MNKKLGILACVMCVFLSACSSTAKKADSDTSAKKPKVAVQCDDTGSRLKKRGC